MAKRKSRKSVYITQADRCAKLLKQPVTSALSSTFQKPWRLLKISAGLLNKNDWEELFMGLVGDMERNNERFKAG